VKVKRQIKIKQPIKTLHSNTAIFAILLGLTLIFFFSVIFQGEIFITPDFGRSDILHLNYPIKNFLSESLKKFELPLWNPYNGNGYPQLAEGQMGTFNPENLLIFGIFSMPFAFNLGLVLIFFQAGVFTYLFCRSINLSKIASLFSAITFSFSGVFVTHIVHFNLIQTLSFFPLQMYLVEKFLQPYFVRQRQTTRGKQKLHLLLLLSIVTAIQFFSGFQQIALYSIITVSFYILFKVWILKAAKIKKILILLLFTLSLTFSLTLSAVQLLPSWELAREAGRSNGVEYSEMNRFPYNPKHLISFLNPYFFGDPRVGSYPIYSDSWGIFWESTGYLGILPLLFTASAIIFLIRKNRNVQFFILLSLFSLLLMTGIYSPLYLVFEFPPLNLFRVPARWIIFFTFSLSILAGFGLQFILKRFRKLRLKYFLAFAIVTAATFDLFLFGLNYNAKAKAKNQFQPPQTYQFLKSDQSFYRTLTLGNYEAWNFFFLNRGWQDTKPYQILANGLDPDLNLLYKIPNFGVYESILPKRTDNLKNMVSSNIQTEANSIKIGEKAKKILDLYGVKYIISTREIKNPNLNKTFESQTILKYFIYKSENTQGLVYFPKNFFFAQTYESLDRLLASKETDLKDFVILNSKLTNNIPNPSNAKAQIIAFTNEKIDIKVTLDSGQLLVLTQSYYPGWRAFDNGKEKEIQIVNAGQQAIFLDKGEHQIEFRFDPDSFKIGKIISLISLALLFFILILSLTKLNRFFFFSQKL